MSNSYFQFKQFTIHHEHCAMKVGTDGVLLGAWAPFEGLPHEARLLDIGTGSGLIALMLAQRYPEAQVLGIDISEDAVRQALENIAASPFAARCIARCTSLQSLMQQAASETGDAKLRFDAIVCNPPFFEESLLPPDAGRRDARHTVSLPFDELARDAARLLLPDGRFAVVMPTAAFDAFHLQCFSEGLSLEVRCNVKTTASKAPKRTLACFRKSMDVARRDEELVLMDNCQRSADYVALTRDFYLY